MTRVLEDIKLDFKDVLIMPKRSELESRSQVKLERTFKFKHATSVEYTGVPLIVANMDHTGTFEMAAALKPYGASVALHKFYKIEELKNYFEKENKNPHTFYSTGITQTDYEKLLYVMNNEKEKRPKFICVDVANGYSRKFVSFVEKLRERYKENVVIMAGNVVTPDMTYDLLERGADIVKIGIGSGSSCITRKITGVGYPQLSAILETADAAHGAGGLICSDGGVQNAGDLAKAFAAGADFVMCGGIFAGHIECSGELDEKTKTMTFYGMSSLNAMEKYYGGKASYRAAEGKAVQVPFKGPVSNTLDELLGGVRSACTYVGASQLKHLSKCTTFIKVNRILNDLYGVEK